MTPKEKAEELVTKMYVNQWRNNTMEYKTAKQCALIAVDEILSAIGFSINDEYWQEVKQEIEKL
jgi:hypothetical protein